MTRWSRLAATIVWKHLNGWPIRAHRRARPNIATNVTRGVTIVIPTWNGLELLERFLPSVITAAHHYSNNSGAPTEIVVVDDGSNDTTVDWLVSRGFVYTELNDQMQATVQGGEVAKPKVPGTLEPEES